MPFEFAHTQYLWLLGFIPILITWYIWQNSKQQTAVRLSAAVAFRSQKFFSKVTLRHSLFFLRLVAYSMLVIALARPQISFSTKTVNSEGIDIMLTLDVSGSMLQKDFIPSRLDAARQVADTFISNRLNDRIGLVLFAAEAYTGCPITIDHKVLRNVLAGIAVTDMANGTAIGQGLGTAVSHLQESEGKTKIVILVTDGENNMGIIDPMTGALMAKAFGIRVYVIGMQIARAPSQITAVGKAVNSLKGESLLNQIASITGGAYYPASDEKSLATVYRLIDQLEKTKVDVAVSQRYEERFYLFALIAAIAVFAEALLRYTILKTIP